MSENLVAVCVIYGFFCALAAALVAEPKQASVAGLLFGLFFGPFGIVAAGFLDRRPKCSRCGGRVNGTRKNHFSVCQHCKLEFTDENGLFEEFNEFCEPKRQDGELATPRRFDSRIKNLFTDE